MASYFDLPPLDTFEVRPSTQSAFHTTATNLLRHIRATSELDRPTNNGFLSASGTPVEWTLRDSSLLLTSDEHTSGTARLDIARQGRRDLLASLTYRVEGVVPGAVNPTPDAWDSGAIYQPESVLAVYAREADASVTIAAYSSAWGGWELTREDWLGESLKLKETSSTLERLGQSSRIFAEVCAKLSSAQGT